MSPDKWKAIKERVEDQFEVEDAGTEHFEEEGGYDEEFIIFRTPQGRMMLECVIRPILLDKKTTYSNRIGSETKVDYIHSDTERSYKLKTYKWDETDETWEELEKGMFE